MYKPVIILFYFFKEQHEWSKTFKRDKRLFNKKYVMSLVYERLKNLFLNIFLFPTFGFLKEDPPPKKKFIMRPKCCYHYFDMAELVLPVSHCESRVVCQKNSGD